MHPTVSAVTALANDGKRRAPGPRLMADVRLRGEAVMCKC
jgi:hypothetical protein